MKKKRIIGRSCNCEAPLYYDIGKIRCQYCQGEIDEYRAEIFRRYNKITPDEKQCR